MPSSRSVTTIEQLDCYLVGGAVRDRLLGISENSDRDWVVVGATPEIMLSLGFKKIGLDFPVFLHPQSHEEYALARTERKSGRGYKGFVVDTSSDVTIEQDLHRRDLTVNSMAVASDGTLIDPYGGKSDLEDGLLRHVSKHFVEDPLRVLRVARFAARFFSKGFIVDPSTFELMQTISLSGELTDLATERVWQEVRAALGEDYPSVFFNVLYICGALERLFPELKSLYERDDAAQSPLAINALDHAAGMTEEIIHRFAVVAYLIGHQAGRRDVSESDPDCSEARDAVRKFCKGLKVPVKYRTLSIQIVGYADQVRQVRKLSAERIVDIIRELDGLRNPAQFELFLNACTIVLKTQSASANEVESAIGLMRSMRDQMSQVDAEALSKIYSSEELRRQIRLAQIAAIEQIR
ncbi:MAG: multifunctional CCA tRNA nucleotidyl transferase/2'3'-cyclic phosphodiesterase/2'nucleotidase/phosphatase [Acidiferrobacterales bacterium]|nr:multifunctional CCA tRNA nucleotidyl transferase/2'3'-cyclic phosphodiesterase/2'nucleotidase/phosphatase [Acidiferrobacterales bacterium]